MTAAELIERLKAFPANTVIYVGGQRGFHEVEAVNGIFCRPVNLRPFISFTDSDSRPDADNTQVFIEISAF